MGKGYIVQIPPSANNTLAVITLISTGYIFLVDPLPAITTTHTGHTTTYSLRPPAAATLSVLIRFLLSIAFPNPLVLALVNTSLNHSGQPSSTKLISAIYI